MKMKKLHILVCLAALMAGSTSCVNLDLNPPSAASSESWYSNPDEIRMSLNDFYRSTFFNVESTWNLDRNTDDWSQRNNIYAVPGGFLSASSTKTAGFNHLTTWSYTYKNVSRANRLLANCDRLAGSYSESSLNVLRAEARFFRAYAYARLTTFWGDVPFYLEDITPEQAFEMGRTPKAEILKQIYEDYDFAIANLPESNANTGTYRVTKGAALGLKARVALMNHDYEVCAQAAKQCMDLGIYKLAPDYGELFRDITLANNEVLWAIPHSSELELGDDGKPSTQSIGSFIPRCAGGTHNAQPSWELLASYEMNNGKTIDQADSGFDPHNPFKNRDPRCLETFVEPGTMFHGVEWNPDPTALKVMDQIKGMMVDNNDSKGGADAKNAAYNGCALKKGARDSWRNTLYNDNPVVIIRYADVMLMYAESMIELGKINNTVLNCINDIRARAYKVGRGETDKYPAISTTDQKELRKILRRERRVEFAWENLRYLDLLRWHQFENAFAHNMYGFSGAAADNIAAKTNGLWFWPETPKFDDEGFPIFDHWATDAKYKGYIKQWGKRVFDSKIYLWPIPSDEVLIMNGKIEQNPGY